MNSKIVVMASVLVGFFIGFYICTYKFTHNTNKSNVAVSQERKTYKDYVAAIERIITNKLSAPEDIDLIVEFCDTVKSSLPMARMTAEADEQHKLQALNFVNDQLQKNNQDTLKTFQSMIRWLDEDKGSIFARYVMNVYCGKLIEAVKLQQ